MQNKNFEANSLIIRNPIINGKTDTVRDSLNSQGMINSFKSMSNPKNGSDNLKRESILKFVLMQNQGNGENLYHSSKFVHEEFNSNSDEEFEF